MRDPHRAALVIRHLHDIAGLSGATLGDVTREDPRVARFDPAGSLPVHPYRGQRIACSRAIRSAVEGCVENSFIMTFPPVKGLMMNMWAVAGEASIGMR